VPWNERHNVSSYEEFQSGELSWEIQDAELGDIADKLNEITDMVKDLPGGDIPTLIKYDQRTAVLKVKF
jgi:hypothetical protein